MKAPTVRSRILMGLLVVTVSGAAWWRCTASIAPFGQREAKDQAESAGLRERLEKMQAVIREVGILEQTAGNARQQIASLQVEIPAGPASVWLPEQVKKHFARFGLTEAVVRMTTVQEVPDLPDHRRGYWSVALPIGDASYKAVGAFVAVAEFEEQHPLIKVLDFGIRPDSENPQSRVVLLNLKALVRNEVAPAPPAHFRLR